MDFEKYKNRLREYLSAHGIKVEGNSGNIHCINPEHSDETESMHVYDERVCCFACDWKGDIYDVCGALEGIADKAEQFKAVERFFGDGYVPVAGAWGGSGSSGGSSTSSAGKKKQAAAFPIPEDREETFVNYVRSGFALETWGRAVKAFKYRDEKGGWLFCTVRFEIEKNGTIKKNVVPFYYTEGGRWRSGIPSELDGHVSLFGLERLAGNELPVLVVEGEKCAQCEVPGYIVVSWIGGANKVRKSDWTPLAERRVVVWPDFDEPGIRAAQTIKSILDHAQILEIVGKHKKGWDVADAIEEGLKPEEIIQESLNPLAGMKLDPYFAYKKFVDDLYPDESLEQLGALYWQYNEIKHYWNRIESRDIDCNAQTWAAEKGLVDLLMRKRIKADVFLNKICGYLRRHANGYIMGENPFINAAISPYLHFQNGCIEFTDRGFEFYDRSVEGELFFKKLYPVNCLDMDFDADTLKDFDLEKACPCFAYFLRHLLPPDDRENEEEWTKTLAFFSMMLAYTMSPLKRDQFVFGFYGDEHTGKTFLCGIIKSLVGEEFVVERPSDQMDSRFSAADFIKAKMYVDADVKSGAYLDEGFIKTYAGNGIVTIENKNEKPINGVRISLTMYFISNWQIRVKGIEGMRRRLKVIPFFNFIKKKDKALQDKIEGKKPKGSEAGEYEGRTFDERPGLLAFALKGWELLLQNNFEFIEPEWIKKGKEEWENTANTVRAFFHETYGAGDVYVVKSRKDLYGEYTDYCKSENIPPKGRNNFYEEMRRISGVTERSDADGDFFVINLKQEKRRDDPF